MRTWCCFKDFFSLNSSSGYSHFLLASRITKLDDLRCLGSKLGNHLSNIGRKSAKKPWLKSYQINLQLYIRSNFWLTPSRRTFTLRLPDFLARKRHEMFSVEMPKDIHQKDSSMYTHHHPSSSAVASSQLSNYSQLITIIVWRWNAHRHQQ